MTKMGSAQYAAQDSESSLMLHNVGFLTSKWMWDYLYHPHFLYRLSSNKE